MEKVKKPLTPQQEAFAVAIVGGMSQADAYRKAYPRSLKWKLDSIYSNASTLMVDAKVAQRITDLQDRVADKTILKVADILNEIRKLAHADVAQLFGADGKMLAPHKLPPEIRACIASVKIDQHGNYEYKLWDKNSAVEKANRILGLYEKDNKQKADALGALLEGLSGKVQGVVADLGDDDA